MFLNLFMPDNLATENIAVTDINISESDCSATPHISRLFDSNGHSVQTKDTY